MRKEGRAISAVRGPGAALAFLTPLGRPSLPTPGDVLWFPAVGAGIGAVLGSLWWGVRQAWDPVIAAAIVVVADLALTGLLHFDGLVDAADGLLAHLTRERRLEVMRSPGTGAFGLGAGAGALVLRWSALGSLHPSVLLLTGIWCGARALMAVPLGTLRYVHRERGGLATAFVPSGGRMPLYAGGIGIVGALACMLGWHPLAGAVAVIGGLVGGGAVLILGLRRLGGFTGDVLGAAGMVFETVALVVAAARW